MKTRQRVAQSRAVRGAGAADPHAVEKGDDRRRPSGEPAQYFAGAVLDRLRAGDAAARQMLHQPQEERQVALGNATLIQREDEIALAGMNQKIRVLDALGDALVGQKLADVVTGEELAEVFRRDVGIDSHGSLQRPDSKLGK